jgi:N-acetylglutamate synthase-like GNAT family acetyltransferase
MANRRSSGLMDDVAIRRHRAEDRLARWRPFPKARPQENRRPRVVLGPISDPRADEAQVSPDGAWVTKIGGHIVGLIQLAQVAPGTARLIALHVDPEWHHTVVLDNLIGTIHAYCREQGCANVILDSHVVPRWMRGVFGRRGFRVVRHDDTVLAVPADCAPARPVRERVTPAHAN